MAQRIQRKRTKGWRMPEGAVYVGRPTMFGNPYEVRRFGVAAALALYRDSLRGFWDATNVPSGTSVQIAYTCHLELLEQFKRSGFRDRAYALWQLKGKDLACWCPLDKPCHAEVLLELANATPASLEDQPR